MSNFERNKGTLILKATGTEDVEKFCRYILSDDKYSDEELDIYENSGDALVNISYVIEPEFMIINNSIYEVKYSVKSGELDGGFEEVTTSLSNPSDIDFHTMHYNGGGSLEEVLEESLKKIRKGNGD